MFPVQMKQTCTPGWLVLTLHSLADQPILARARNELRTTTSLITERREAATGYTAVSSPDTPRL